MRDQYWLSQCIEQWTAHRSNTQSESTATRGKTTMKQFRAAVCDGLKPGPDGRGDIKINHIDIEHVTAWRVTRGEGNSLNTDMSAVREFFKYCNQMRLRTEPRDPLIYLRSVKVADKDWVRVPQARWAELLDAARDPVDRMLIAATLYIVGRASEMRQITVGQVRNVQNNKGRIPLNRIKTVQFDQIVVVPELAREFDAYLKWYEAALAEQGIKISDDHQLIPRFDTAHTGRDVVTGRMGKVPTLQPERTPVRLELPVQRALAKLGYPTHREGMHSLRRSAAASMYYRLLDMEEKGLLKSQARPIEIVSDMMGHKSTDTTWKYIGLNLRRSLRDAVLAHNPEGFYSDPEVEALPEPAEREAAHTRVRHLSVVREAG
jgi:integrase